MIEWLSDWVTKVLRLKFSNCNFATAILRLQFCNWNFTTEILQLKFCNWNFATEIIHVVIVTAVIVSVVTVVIVTVVTEAIGTSFSKNNLTHYNRWDVLMAAFCDSRNIFNPHSGTPPRPYPLLSKFIRFFLLLFKLLRFFLIGKARYRINITKYVIKEPKRHQKLPKFNKNLIHIVQPPLSWGKPLF